MARCGSDKCDICSGVSGWIRWNGYSRAAILVDLSDYNRQLVIRGEAAPRRIVTENTGSDLRWVALREAPCVTVVVASIPR